MHVHTIEEYVKLFDTFPSYRWRS